MSARLLNYILIVVVVILFGTLIRSCESRDRMANAVQAQNQDLKTYRNREQQWVSSKAVLTGTVREIKASIVTKDSMLNELRKRLDAATVSLTIYKTRTNSITQTASTITEYDTVKGGDTTIIYPVYKTQFNDRWQSYTITAGVDTIVLDYTAYNLFVVKQHVKKTGLFKPNIIELEITNANPKTITTEAQSFVLQPKKQNRLLWYATSFLAGSITAAVVLDR